MSFGREPYGPRLDSDIGIFFFDVTSYFGGFRLLCYGLLYFFRGHPNQSSTC